VDDFVFLTFLLGNDFFPALPGFHIINGGLDVLMGIYKSLLPNLDGYLTIDAKLVLKNVEKFFARIAKIEED
jgi:5'-3' exonuclease